jgi:hypothetical protein
MVYEMARVEEGQTENGVGMSRSFGLASSA